MEKLPTFVQWLTDKSETAPYGTVLMLLREKCKHDLRARTWRGFMNHVHNAHEGSGLDTWELWRGAFRQYVIDCGEGTVSAPPIGRPTLKGNARRKRVTITLPEAVLCGARNNARGNLVTLSLLVELALRKNSHIGESIERVERSNEPVDN